MKLVCSQSDLNTNLSLVSRVVPSRPTHPVLGNVLLEADQKNQRVLLTAFDLSVGIQTSFNADVETGGEITLPAKLLNDIVSRLPSGEITLEDDGKGTDSDSLIVTLTSATGRYQVRGMSSEEFPELPEVNTSVAVHIPVEVLKAGLQGSLFATSSDETKQVLTGVHLTVQSDKLEFAATDGHRLAVVETNRRIEESATTEATQELDDHDLPVEFTLPARALRELERIVSKAEAQDIIAIQFEPGQIVCQGGEQRLTSRTLEGQYPSYHQLLPKHFQRQIILDRRQLLSAVERIAVLADQKNNIVKFNIDSVNQRLHLSVEAKDLGSGRESMEVQISGDSLEIAFNVKYLIDGLKALYTSDIQIQMNEANSPVIFMPLGGLKMTYLIMPVQIRK
ncbi:MULTISPECIES: DNA polymerase III subunit beta [unclassified Moorena]|uniref:DNA polymerase III subunit beta n=1 Tax=unclassified Moorena TaxID=2683338 RepID=UPI0013C164B7|nr:MULTISPECIES: DNA polymerase III subunit beta [unclassified Moorena]NEO06684.1 DNA polymerase III subunit beta [Moorena sp. SIO3I8]NEP24929.1 DNA polymerase III subunit beta [Moorena sp. SIO3I6]NEQ56516.1 DNA polymerase III subunit beta [Moorena sp. SIO4A1]